MGLHQPNHNHRSDMSQGRMERRSKEAGISKMAEIIRAASDSMNTSVQSVQKAHNDKKCNSHYKQKHQSATRN